MATPNGCKCKTCANWVYGRRVFCDECKKKTNCEKSKKYQTKNKEKVTEAKKQYWQANPSRIARQKTIKKRSRKKLGIELRDHVVVHRLGLTKETAPKELVELKREQILLFRAIKALNKEIIDNQRRTFK